MKIIDIEEEIKGRIFECINGRTLSLPVNKILSEREFKENCSLYVLFYNKTIKVQAIFKILSEEVNEMSEIEEIYCNICD